MSDTPEQGTPPSETEAQPTEEAAVDPAKAEVVAQEPTEVAEPSSDDSNEAQANATDSEVTNSKVTDVDVADSEGANPGSKAPETVAASADDSVQETSTIDAATIEEVTIEEVTIEAVATESPDSPAEGTIERPVEEPVEVPQSEDQPEDQPAKQPEPAEPTAASTDSADSAVSVAAAEEAPDKPAPDATAVDTTAVDIAVAESASSEDAPDAQANQAAEKPAKAAPAAAAKKQKPKPAPVPLSPEIAALDEARKARQLVNGKVIGWNQGGFHVAIDQTPAFCPRSAISLAEPEDPASYVDQELDFLVLEIRNGGKRIVVSRAAAIRAKRSVQRKQAMATIKEGAVVSGTVASITDFGAFVDLGGVQGLLHVSEIARSRVEHPSEVLTEDQEVEVKILKVEKGGKRISLSRKALEPDPWKEIDQFNEGDAVDGKVERAEKFGVLVEIAPGLSGLIPSSSLTLPSDASPQRVYPRGKAIRVQIVSIDRRRKRISLLPEGAQVDGSTADLKEYRRKHPEQKLGALAAAFERARKSG